MDFQGSLDQGLWDLSTPRYFWGMGRWGRWRQQVEAGPFSQGLEGRALADNASKKLIAYHEAGRGWSCPKV